MANKKLRIAVGVSGSGRSLANLIRVQDDQPFRVAGVISSTPDCQACEIALQANVPLIICSFTKDAIADSTKELERWLELHQIEMIVLAGFVKKFPIIKHWYKRIINIHPALLPKHGGPGMFGMRVHRSVKDSKDQFSGATIHYVNENYDEGEIIAQSKIPVSESDTVEEIANRVFEVELDILPRTLAQLSQEFERKQSNESK